MHTIALLLPYEALSQWPHDSSAGNAEISIADNEGSFWDHEEPFWDHNVEQSIEHKGDKENPSKDPKVHKKKSIKLAFDKLPKRIQTKMGGAPRGVGAMSTDGAVTVSVEGASAGHNQYCGVAWRHTWWGGYPYFQSCSAGLSCTGYSSGVCLNDPRQEGELCGSDWASTTGCADGLYCDSPDSWFAVTSGTCRRTLDTNTWVQPQTLRPHELPEARVARVAAALASSPALSGGTGTGAGTVGVAISGGGARSYAAAIGYMRGLKQLGLLDRVTYLSGTSGGGWFTTIFTYLNNGPGYDAQHPGASLDAALGAYTPPGAAAAAAYAAAPPFADGQLGKACTTPVFRSLAHLSGVGLTEGFPHVWRETVAAAYLAPFGLDDDAARYTWDTATRAEIVRRNPALGGAGARWFEARAGAPFPIVTGAVLGPHAAAPFAGLDFALAEFTPLYTGVPGWRRVGYASGSGQQQTAAVGGYVEPFAFGGEAVAGGRDNIHRAAPPAGGNPRQAAALLVGSARVIPRENSESAEKGVMLPLSTLFGVTSNWGNKWTGCTQAGYTCLASSALNGALRELIPSLLYWSPLTARRAAELGVAAADQATAFGWSLGGIWLHARKLVGLGSSAATTTTPAAAATHQTGQHSLRRRATSDEVTTSNEVTAAALDLSDAADPTNGRRTFFDDGGAVDYAAILPLVLRRADRIVVLLNSAYDNGHACPAATPAADCFSLVGTAQPADGGADPAAAAQVDGWDDSLRAYFGWGLPGREQVTGEWAHSQVFRREDLCGEFDAGGGRRTTRLDVAVDAATGAEYVANAQGCTRGVAAALWELKKAGKPLVHTVELEVVENTFYGIPANSGYRPKVTFVVLSRAASYMAELRAGAGGGGLAAQMSATFAHTADDAGDKIGNFPHFKADAQNSYVPGTGGQVPEISLTELQTRLLADYTHWTVTGSAESQRKFRAAFGQ